LIERSWRPHARALGFEPAELPDINSATDAHARLENQQLITLKDA
jgi:hypothetical protein